MVLFGGGVGRAEEGEFGEYFFNQINYCWETSHFSPFNLYSMGNPSNTPARSARQDQRDAASDQGGRQKMGWSAGNEQTTGGKASGKACGEEGKPRDVSAAPQTREEGRKLEQAGAWAEWDGVEWDGMRWDRMGWLGTARSFSLRGGGIAPGRMEDLIGLCLSLQSEFSDFPRLPVELGRCQFTSPL